MHYRFLGNSGVQVSEISLGSWLTYGHTVENSTARDTIMTAYEQGVNYFDTADVYNNHEAERVLGEVLGSVERSDLFIGSKVYFPIGDGPNDQGLSRKHIFEGIENSLKALDMQYLDLYQCHRWDENTPLHETVRAMSDLISQGIIHYWGVSMWSANQIIQACRIADEISGYRPISNQPRYNLLDREVETSGVQDACAEEGLGMVLFSPLAEGLLTGKYAGGEIPEDSRAADDRINQFIQQKWSQEVVQKTARLVDLAESIETTAAVLSLAWLLDCKAVSSVIIGASNPAQLKENLRAINLDIPREIASELEEIF